MNHGHFLTTKESERGKSNKAENLKLEQDLDYKRKIIQMKINEKKNERNNLIQQIGLLEKEISDVNIDLDLITKYGKEGEIEHKNESNNLQDSAKKEIKKKTFSNKKSQSEEKKNKTYNLFRVNKNKEIKIN